MRLSRSFPSKQIMIQPSRKEQSVRSIYMEWIDQGPSLNQNIVLLITRGRSMVSITSSYQELILRITDQGRCLQIIFLPQRHVARCGFARCPFGIRLLVSLLLKHNMRISIARARSNPSRCQLAFATWAKSPARQLSKQKWTSTSLCCILLQTLRLMAITGKDGQWWRLERVASQSNRLRCLVIRVLRILLGFHPSNGRFDWDGVFSWESICRNVLVTHHWNSFLQVQSIHLFPDAVWLLHFLLWLVSFSELVLVQFQLVDKFYFQL